MNIRDRELMHGLVDYLLYAKKPKRRMWYRGKSRKHVKEMRRRRMQARRMHRLRKKETTARRLVRHAHNYPENPITLHLFGKAKHQGGFVRSVVNAVSSAVR